MDQSRALRQLMEAADLVFMLEELTANGKQLSASSISGLRLTLRGVREALVRSHDALAAGTVSRARSEGAMPSASKPKSDIQFTRKDLRTTVEQYVE